MAEDDEVRITLRLPEELRDRLKNATDETGRSMNAEIVDRLTQSFEGSFVEGDYFNDIGEKFDEMRGHVSELVENLTAATQREADLNMRVSALVDALTQAQTNNERLINLLEKGEHVGQKA